MLFRKELVAVIIILVIAGILGIQRIRRDDGEPVRAEAETLASLDFSTYIEGGVRDVTTDRKGNIYIAGGTTSPDFAATPGAYQVRFNPGEPENRDVSRSDAFVVKLDAKGKLIWSTLIGGPNHDRAYAIEVDALGYVYIAGRAGAGFPVTKGAFQTQFMGGQEARSYGNQDGFIAKLSPDGTKVIWASYFGATDFAVVRDLDLDAEGNIYVASYYNGGTYPASTAEGFKRGFLNSPVGQRDGVVAKIKGDGSRVLWATYIGGSGNESVAPSIRVDHSGNVFFLTTTDSGDMPTTAGAFDRTFNGGRDFYLAKISSEGLLVYGTYLGGSGEEHVETHELAIDAEGNAIIASGTTSADFPIVGKAFQKTYSGSGASGTGYQTNYPGDIIVAKLSSDGSRLLASTFIGGQYGEAAEGVGLDREGNVCLSGATFSDNFPVTRNAFQSKKKGKTDAFAVKLSADFSRLLYSTYIGGSNLNFGRAATSDANGNCYIGGETNSKDWPIRAAMQPDYGQLGNGFLSRFSLADNSQKAK
jgi:Beta-propeller repeat